MMFGPFLETIFVGQINTFALLFLYASLFFAERDQDSLAGCSLGLAVIFKTSPLIFIIYFILLKRYKIAIVSVIILVLASIITAIQFRPGIVYDFLLIVPKLSNEIHINVFNESLISAIYTLYPSLDQGIIGKVVPILHKALLAILILIISYLVRRNGVLSKEQKFWLFNIFIVLMVIFSPLVWYHHLVFFLLPIAALLVINEHWIFRISGLFALSLIQIVRPFEHYIIRFPWPILMAQILLLVITLIMLLIKFKLTNFQHYNNSANR
jgi:alpha-1,2-mannosyltransferase